jgi:hypothetical protein
LVVNVVHGFLPKRDVTVLDTGIQLLHNTRMDKQSKIYAILEAMEEAYEREGIDGDFDDARRYYRDDASEDEINSDYAKWCVNVA